MLQAFRHLVAIDQAATEHFLVTGVLGVAGIVEDFHGDKATEFLKNDGSNRRREGSSAFGVSP
jgi:hypothetical protein